MPTSTEKSSPTVPSDLPFTLVALLRADGHLCNVLTHVSAGDWGAIEQAIAVILRPRARVPDLSSVARNMLELICDGRGVTGPVMRPFFLDAIRRCAGKSEMRRLDRKVRRLRLRMSAAAGRPRADAPRPNKPVALAAAPPKRPVRWRPGAEIAQWTGGARP